MVVGRGLMTSRLSAHHLTLGREMVVIHWKINNVTGNGSAVEEHIGRAWVDEMNVKYGTGTHWLEWC